LVAILVLSGIALLHWGLPRAENYRLPWRWRVGVLYLGLGLIFWPLFYFYCGHADLEMVWIPIWVATVLTFVTGAKRLLMANTYGPGGSFRHPYDLGWLMRSRRPRNPKPTPGELMHDEIEAIIEDQSNPLAPVLRFERRRAEKANQSTETDRDSAPQS
jgi:hypothetical protein